MVQELDELQGSSKSQTEALQQATKDSATGHEELLVNSYVSVEPSG
jgi:hypothetical protein